jgi:hypothetical protein
VAPCSRPPIKKRIGLLNRQCSFIKGSGERCKGTATGPAGLCWAHAPENAEQRRRTASRGGSSRPSREVRTLKADLRELIGRVDSGELEPTPANTMIRAYSVLIELIKLERGVYLEEDLAARLEALKGERPHAS